MAIKTIGGEQWDFVESSGVAITVPLPAANVPLPTQWRMFGPLEPDRVETVWTRFFHVAGGHKARSLTEVAIEAIDHVPTRLEVDGKMLDGRDVTLTGGTLDLATLFDGHEERQQVFLFAELDVADDADIAFGAGTDYWMKWWIDGQVVMDTMDTGNVAHPIGHADQCFRLPIAAGKHLLAVQLIAGTASWVFKAAAATPEDEALAALKQSDSDQWAMAPELNQIRPPRPMQNWEYVTAIRADGSYSDLAVECAYRIDSPNGNVGIVFAAQDSNHYYYAYIPTWGQLWRARAFYAAIGMTDASGHIRNLAMQLMPNVPCHLDIWRTLKVERAGSDIQLWVNGVKGPAVRDDTYGPGRVGVAGFGDFVIRDFTIHSSKSVKSSKWLAGKTRGYSWSRVEEDLDFGDFQHPGQLVRLGDDIILPLTIGRNESCHKLDDTNSAHYLYRSNDGGQSWERYAGPIQRSAMPDGARCVPEPGVVRSVAFDEANRRFILHDSYDQQQTWREPITGKLTGDWERDIFRDGSVNGVSGFCQLNDGALLVTIGHGYPDLFDVIPHVGEGTWGTAASQPYCTVSRDDGLTWSEPVPLDNAAIRTSATPDSPCAGFSETAPAQLPNGKIVAIARPYRSPYMWQTESTDDGKTWRQACYAPFSGHGAPVLVATRSGYLALAQRGPGDALMCSYDGGLNWDAGTMIDYNGLFNGSAIEVEPDVVLIAYPQSMDEIRPAYARVQRIRISPDGPVALAS